MSIRLATLFLSAAGLLQVSFGQTQRLASVDPVSLNNFIVYRDRAFILGDPILVSGPFVTQMNWSPNGQFALVERWSRPYNVLDIQAATQQKLPELPIHFLSLYSLATGRMTDVARYTADQGAEIAINWVPESSTALLVVTSIGSGEQGQEPEQIPALFVLNTDSGSFQEFRPWSSTGNPFTIDAIPSPSKPFAFLKAVFLGNTVKETGKPERRAPIRVELLMTALGGKIAAVPLSDTARNATVAWSREGNVGYIRELTPSGWSHNWYSVKPDDMRLKPIEKPSDLWLGEEPAGLMTIREVPETSVNGKFSAPIRSLWLETLDPDSQSRVLLAADGSNGDVNRTLDAASFISQGSLYIRPISEVPKARYDEAVAAWRRNEALNQARQVGLAAIMYAADHDDVYPGSGDRFQDLLAPYLRDMGALNGFNYTYQGGPASGIREPASTELGYIGFDDGRAIVYADGHSKWVPKQKV